MKVIDLLNYHNPINKLERIIIKDVETLQTLEMLRSNDTSKYNNNSVDRFYCINNDIEILIYK